MFGKRNFLVAIIIIVAFVAVTFVTSPGLYTIDEFIYYVGAYSQSESGDFAITNLGNQFKSDDLNLVLLVSGPQGYTPQYPIGTAILGAPLLALFGTHGMMAR